MAFPTETVYGLGACALEPEAVAAIFAVKGRPSTDPLIVHVADISGARVLTTHWDERAEKLAQRFWPGPLTLVLPKASFVPDEVTAGRGTVAIRVPAHKVAHGLLVLAGVPVAAPSANRFGRISPTTADAVEAELAGAYDLLLDAGPTDVGVESTVLDLTGDIPVLLRPGGVTSDEIEAEIGRIEVPERRSQQESVPAAAPGQFLRHYSPATPLVVVSGSSDLLTRTLEALQRRGIDVGVVDLPDDPGEAARALYTRLRAADGTASLLLIGEVDARGLGLAVNDRIYRASQGNTVIECDERTLDRIAHLVRTS